MKTKPGRRRILAGIVILGVCSVGLLRARVWADDDDERSRGWPQWGQNPQHSGTIDVEGQRLERLLADRVYDPFVPLEQHDALAQQGVGFDLLAHYQAPLVDGQDAFMEFKSGRWVVCDDNGNPIPPDTVCGSNAWNSQIWNEKRLHWENGRLVTKWTFASDWKPEPDGFNLGGWEPVFHAVLAGRFVYVPGFGGTVWKVNRSDGSHGPQAINPFGTADANTFVSGPLSADRAGNIYYNVLKLDPDDPWSFGPAFNGIGGPDIPDAWLVKISADGTTSMVSYKAGGSVQRRVQHEHTSMAAKSCGQAATRALPLATTGCQRDSGHRARWNDLFGDGVSQPVCQPLFLCGCVECGPHAQVGRFHARPSAGWL
jgi:hypothetical protein